MKILAIDFETADYGRDSACAIGLAMIEGGKLTDQTYYLIRPPRSEVVFSDIHGLTWADLAAQPDFAAIWQRVEPLMTSADVWAAHNISFDRSVLRACAQANDIMLPVRPWLCSLEVSRSIWPLASHKLSNVCTHLGIDLNHHHAMSDAKACASIIMAANAKAGKLEKWLRHS